MKCWYIRHGSPTLWSTAIISPNTLKIIRSPAKANKKKKKTTNKQPRKKKKKRDGSRDSHTQQRSMEGWSDNHRLQLCKLAYKHHWLVFFIFFYISKPTTERKKNQKEYIPTTIWEKMFRVWVGGAWVVNQSRCEEGGGCDAIISCVESSPTHTWEKEEKKNNTLVRKKRTRYVPNGVRFISDNIYFFRIWRALFLDTLRFFFWLGP